MYIYIYIMKCEWLQNNSTHSLTTHISLYKTSFICAIIMDVILRRSDNYSFTFFLLVISIY